MLGIYRVATQLVASREVLSSTELEMHAVAWQLEHYATTTLSECTLNFSQLYIFICR
jgi:hypothetical protein